MTKKALTAADMVAHFPEKSSLIMKERNAAKLQRSPIKKIFFFVLFGLFLADPAWPQALQCGTYQKEVPFPQWYAPGDSSDIYLDRFGNLYSRDEVTMNYHFNAFQANCTNTGYFNLICDGPFTPGEMTTLCAVFNYLSSLITPTPQVPNPVVNIYIRKESFINQQTGDPDMVVLGDASPLWSALECGISSSLVQQALLGNRAGASLDHGHIRINSNFDWHTFNPANPSQQVPSNQFDLYSVVLHEALHVLGFASNIAVKAGQGTPLFGSIYSVWDTYLYSNVENKFLLRPVIDPHCCDRMEFDNEHFDMPDDVTQGCASEIFFRIGGAGGTNLVEVNDDNNSPNVPNTLSHLPEVCNGGEHYVMNSSISPGTKRRTPHQDEIEILCALGYDVNSCMVTHCNVEAVDDGVYAVEQGTPLSVSKSLLTINDVFPATGTSFMFDMTCGNLPAGSFQVNANGLSVVITTTSLPFGAYSFCYSLSGCDGRCDDGIVTFVVTNPNIGQCCDPTNGCNINCLGDMEAFAGDYDMRLALGQSLGDCFRFNQTNTTNTPDLFFSPISVGLCGGNSYTVFPPSGKMLSFITGEVFDVSFLITEGVAFPLCEPILIGDLTQIRFLASTGPACIDREISAKFEFCTKPPLPGINVYNNPGITSGQTLVPITSDFQDNPQFGLHNSPSIVNNSNNAWNFLLLSGTYTQTAVPTVAASFFDNIEVLITRNFASRYSINPAITSTTSCLKEVLTLDYTICNNTDRASSVITLTVNIPPGLTFVPTPDFPSMSITLPSGWLPAGECKHLSLSVQVNNDPTLIGQVLQVELVGSGLPTTCWKESVVTSKISPIFCLPNFTCPCSGTNQLNIDATASSPYYSADLQGVLWTQYAIANNLPLVWNPSVHHGCIAIAGRLIIDNDLHILGCQDIRMQPCSEIVVGLSPGAHPNHGHSVSPSETTFMLSFSSISGCEQMWKGIRVIPRAELRMRSNILVADAQFAAWAEGAQVTSSANTPTRISISGNTFVRNHVAVRATGGFGDVVQHKPFEGNTFIGRMAGQPLLPPCTPNLANYSSSIGYAGVSVEGVSFSVGEDVGSVYTNTFQDTRNGVIGERANLEVHHADFIDITDSWDYTNAPPSYAAGAAGVGVLANTFTTALVKNCRFDDVRRAVYSNSLYLTVVNNLMPSVDVGVTSIGARKFKIADNTDITYASRGVVCTELRPQVFNTGFEVLRNTFNNPAPFLGMVQFSKANQPAVLIENAVNTPLKNARIWDNRVLTGSNRATGFEISNTNKWVIDQNAINLFGSGGAGIQLSNAYSNRVLTNNITDAPGGSNASSASGLYTDSGTDNIFCCNTITGTQYGSTFFNDCDKTELRHNIMDHHEYSLYCEGGTKIGTQFSKGNKFESGSGIAYHGGDIDQVLGSAFRVLNTQVPHWPVAGIETPNTQFAWFVPTGTAPDCAASQDDPKEPCVLPPNPPRSREEDADDSDRRTARGQWTGDVLRWESARRLYERGQMYSGLIGQDAVVDSFLTAAANGHIGAYYAAERVVQDIHALPALGNQAMEQALNALDQNHTDVATQLAGLSTAFTSQDSARVYQAADSVFAASRWASAALQQWSLWSDSARNARAAAALVLVNNLPATDVVETNRKAVLKVYLETLGHGIPHLNAQQVGVIAPIAHQCPADGGTAVFMARVLYQYVEEKTFWDDSLCARGEYRAAPAIKKQAGVSTIQVMPNPANDAVIVSGWTLADGQSVQVMLTNIQSGTVVSAETSSGQVRIPTGDLPTGLYICHVRTGTAPPVAVKLVIVH